MENTNTSFYLFLILLSIFLNFVLTQPAPENSLITQLPGFNGTLPSKHYAGYVTVEKNYGRNLYYYFVTSEGGNSSKDPVVLWLNGGPGCSSFDGFVYEHGPFNFEKPKTRGTLPKLQLNPYSWSKVSNIIYLDSPAGAGFSYSKNDSGYSTGDFQTASDTHTFLLEWFKLYPEFLSNPLFISGESFAGVYIPTLAHEIVKGIEAGVNPVLNFKGYMIGNGVTDRNFDGNALVPFAHGMGLIPDQLFEDATKECKGELYGRHRENIKCRSLLIRVDLAVGRLNIYDILEPCYHSPDTLVNATNVPHSFRKLGETVKPLPIRKRMFGRAWPLGGPVEDGIVPSWRQLSEGRAVLCTDDEVATAWLNNDAVRKAIHTVDKSVVKEWDLCSDTLIYDHDAGSMIEYHRNLTSKGYRALIFRSISKLLVVYLISSSLCKNLYYFIPIIYDDSNCSSYVT
ncbi:putative carboxypeptidase C [Lupinus albus]|uniref:Putative carboxypeptidase C n=1 Tax=Lupinus albus TaxID=3870 RepID=A0A6A4QYA7_LUPAL|nr:putative carboxypeptidase C [Lupinus albus]